MCEGTRAIRRRYCRLLSVIRHPPSAVCCPFVGSRRPSSVIVHVVPCSLWLPIVHRPFVVRVGGGMAAVGRCHHLHDVAVSTRIPPYEQWLITAGAGAGSISSLVSSVWGAVTFTKWPLAPAFPCASSGSQQQGRVPGRCCCSRAAGVVKGEEAGLWGVCLPWEERRGRCC
jgi:hypothetical protein